MITVVTLIRKNLLESRWILLICSSSLFGLCWIFVFAAHRTEIEIQKATGRGPMGMLRALGGSSMDFSTAAIEMAFWNHPFVLLVFSIWAISRGSVAVAGEIEKGTMDLILSRPVGRSSFLLSHVITVLLGFVAMTGSMVVGNLVGSHLHTLISPATPVDLIRPALNLIAFGWAVFGFAFIFSTTDLVRWRPNLIASVATMAEFIILVLSSIPPLELKWLEKFTIFKLYDPVEAVIKGANLSFSCGILGLIGGVGVVGGFLIFARRDLPAGS